MKQNITLKVDKDLLRKVRVIAARKETSVTQLLSEELEQLPVDLLRRIIGIDGPIGDAAAGQDVLARRVAPDQGENRTPYPYVLKDFCGQVKTRLRLKEQQCIGLASDESRFVPGNLERYILDNSYARELSHNIDVGNRGVARRSNKG